VLKIESRTAESLERTKSEEESLIGSSAMKSAREEESVIKDSAEGNKEVLSDYFLELNNQSFGATFEN
jgi:hypothetical protein